jgi:hypothetical protein
MQNQTHIELKKAIITSLDSLARWGIILNGAAAAGTLTFIGAAIDKKDNFSDWSMLGTSTLLFGIGTLLGVFCYVCKIIAMNFESQVRTPSDNASRDELEIYLDVTGKSSAFMGISAILFVIALLIFIAGVFCGKLAIFG